MPPFSTRLRGVATQKFSALRTSDHVFMVRFFRNSLSNITSDESSGYEMTVFMNVNHLLRKSVWDIFTLKKRSGIKIYF